MVNTMKKVPTQCMGQVFGDAFFLMYFLLGKRFQLGFSQIPLGFANFDAKKDTGTELDIDVVYLCHLDRTQLLTTNRYTTISGAFDVIEMSPYLEQHVGCLISSRLDD